MMAQLIAMMNEAKLSRNLKSHNCPRSLSSDSKYRKLPPSYHIPRRSCDSKIINNQNELIKSIAL
jgi:hypothetical protein